VLLVDSLGAVFGGVASASSATTYIESAAGVAAGGRTGLASLVTALGFFLALFFSPWAAVVPPQATAGALIVVGYLMCGIVREIPFGDFEEGFPALATIVAMPFTYSITNGIGAGMVSYAFIKVVRGKAAELHPALALVALAFVVYFAEPWLLKLLAR
jgi:AGZA family xanthine/uracil permease-like MFS transporter